MADIRLASRMAGRLATNATIFSLAGPRILDFDYRTTSWNAAPVEVMDADGLMLPTIVVDDRGASSPIFGRMNDGEHALVYVWAFSTRTKGGLDEVHALMNAVKRALHYWQDPVTKGVAIWAGRLGSSSPDDGSMDRTEFRVSGVPPT